MANKSLDELYAENYLGVTSPDSGLIQEATNDVSDEDDSSEDKDIPAFLKKKKKSKKSKGGFDAGKHYAEKNTFDSLYSTFMEQFDEDEDMGFDEGGDDTFDFDEGDDFSDEGDDQSFTLSELRAMTLGELCDLLSDGGYEDEDNFDDDFGGEDEFEDEIPMESYGQTGGGAHHGANGNYSGKAGRQSPTTHVKGNGDADFSKQDTGYDPEDTEGSEGSEHGAKGDYSGKAHRQPATSHVKGNGDANFGKQNTGYRTRSGKKDKNYF